MLNTLDPPMSRAIPATLLRHLPPFALALALLAPAAQAELVAVSDAQSRALGIETAAVVLQDQGLTPALPARVRVPVDKLRIVAAPLGGLVQEMHAAAGQTVKKGQLLARLSSPDLLMLQRDAAQANSAALLARQTQARDAALYAEGIIAKSRLQASEAALAQANAAAVQGARALAMAGAGGGLSGAADIRSPISGVVLEQYADLGQRLDPAAPVFRIGDLSSLWLEIEVPVGDAAAMTPGLPVSVAGSGASGKLLSVGQQVGPAQTVTVRALLDQGTENLKAGQQVSANIRVDLGGESHSGLWRVPAAAVARRQEGEGKAAHSQAYVFLSRAGGFEPVPVEVAQGGADAALVRGPLKAGDRVAARGVAAIKAQWMGIGGAAE